MVNGISKQKAVFIVAMALTGLVAGCASIGEAQQPPEEQVKKLATERWKAEMASHIDTAYNYVSPSYRGVHDLSHFRNQVYGHGSVKGAEVYSVDCALPSAPDVCVVRMKLSYLVPLGGPAHIEMTESYINERWVKEDGKWWWQPSR